MPVTRVRGSIFDSGADVLVNPVNCVGVMGAGLAKEFKRRFPEYYFEYREMCKDNCIDVGTVVVFPFEFPPKWIISFPTKKHWKNPSKLEYISAGLQDLVEVVGYIANFHQEYNKKEILTVAIPALGCGLGELDFETVSNLISKYFSESSHNILLYEPHETNN